ncbi:MAG: hypothetical protein ACRC5T_05215 [Cetobacterium sp.]
MTTNYRPYEVTVKKLVTLDNLAKFKELLDPSIVEKATTAQLTQAVTDIKGSSLPVALNTMTKLAAAINNDPAFHTTVTQAIALKTDLSVYNAYVVSNNSAVAANLSAITAMQIDKASKTYVDTAVSGLVDAAPEALDTLKELASALGNDPNFATTIATQIGLKADKTYVDGQLALKADKATTFTKTEVTASLALKADKSDTFTKAQVTSSLNLKADKSDTFTKVEVNSSLNLKADKSDTFTKAEVTAMVTTDRNEYATEADIAGLFLVF